MNGLIRSFLILLLFTTPLLAQQDSVRVIALFNNKALMMVNGEQKLMRKGEVFHGVTLISSTSRGAEVRFADGQQQKLTINQSISHGFKKPDKSKMTIYANSSGMFMLDGEINGKPTTFLVDTGATYVALSQAEADRLNLPYESSRRDMARTASELVPVWNIKLGRVKVGDISVPNVDAVVLEGSQPHNPLLGMSFLRYLNLQRNGAVMTLEQKY
jgi:aspartyl protease family protein